MNDMGQVKGSFNEDISEMRYIFSEMRRCKAMMFAVMFIYQQEGGGPRVTTTSGT